MRELINKTRDEFGEMIGVTGDVVYTYEARNTKPKQTTLSRISSLVGLSSEQLTSDRLTESNLPDHVRLKLKKLGAYLNDHSFVEEPQALYSPPTIDEILRQQNNLIKTLTLQSETANGILQRITDNVENKLGDLDANLKDALGRVESLKYDVFSGRQVTLESLARIEGKKPGALVKEADSIVLSLLSSRKQQNKSAGKGK